MIHLCKNVLNTKYTIKNVNIDEFDKIFKYYITTHNKKIDNNYTANIEINYHYNTDYINIKSFLSFYIDNCESGGFKFSNINHMIINTISCMCNMSYKHYINQPISMLERRINFIISRNPKLINSLDRNKNHPLRGKYSHIPFNNVLDHYKCM